MMNTQTDNGKSGKMGISANYYFRIKWKKRWFWWEIVRQK